VVQSCREKSAIVCIGQELLRPGKDTGAIQSGSCIRAVMQCIWPGVLLAAKTSAQLGDWRSEFDVEDRVRHCDGLIGRGAIPFVERDFVCYRVTE
jgi:hypothetical protein